MERSETKQSEQGHVSAPGVSPKDKEQRVTTGIPRLDRLLNKALTELLAMTYVCLELSKANGQLDETITAMLKAKTEPFRRGEFPKASDFEAEIAPSNEWFAFLDGHAASRGTEDEADELGDLDRDKIIEETVNVLRGKEAAAETGTSGKPGFMFEEALSNVRKKLERFNALTQKEILEAVLEQVHTITDRASRLNALKERVYRIYDCLDVKAKCAITVLQELAAVDGCSVGVDFGYELLYTTARNKRCVEQAQAELPDDADVKILAEVFELANFINQAV